MPINPVRFTPMEFPDNPRPVPIDFSPLADIGRTYGQYRDRQEVGQLLQGAIDPKTGMLDLNRATTALAISGRDPETYLRAATAQAGVREREAAQRALEAHYNRVATETERANRAREDQPQQTFVPGGLTTPPYIVQMPRKVGEPPLYHPVPVPSMQAPPPPPPSAPGSQSALPGGPTLAAFDPENAPPYRVAGPPQPVPQQPAASPQPAPVTQPAATPVAPASGLSPAQDEWVNKYVQPGARPFLRGLLDYSQDPHKVPGTEKEKQDLFGLAATLRPGWSPDEYAQRQKANLTATERKAAAEQATKFDQVLGFNKTFDDKYTVSGLPGFLGLGSRAMEFGRSNPERMAKMLGMSTDEALAATGWWQGYDRYKNVVRHGQFGAALTPNELRVFEAADISPNMDARLIRNNLAQQQTVLQGALQREARSMASQGMTPDKIEAQLGVPLKDMGTPAAERQSTTQSGFDDQTIARYKTTPTAALSRAQKLLDAGADPARVRDLLNQIDPSLPAKLGL